jgi:hypothetical protein
MCEAAGANPTVGCPLKPRSIERTTSARTRITVTPELNANPPRTCQQDSVTFPLEVGAKFLQKLQFGSPDWEAAYHTLRNTIEGFNGIARNGARAALGDADRRRIRGVAAQTLFVALLVFGTNVSIIKSFSERLSETDGVPRRARKRRRKSRALAEWNPMVDARSGAPPP